MINSLVKSIVTEVINPAGRSSVQVAQLTPTLRKKSESLGKTTSTQNNGTRSVNKFFPRKEINAIDFEMMYLEKKKRRERQMRL